MTRALPSRDQIGPDTPLRLADAVATAYPCGGMTVSGLRTEARKGRLVIERVAGKDFTTLAAIERMRVLCREQQPAPTCGSAPNAAIAEAPSLTRPAGSLSTENINKALAAFTVTAEELSERLNATSASNTATRRKRAPVIQLRSRSSTS